MNFAASYKIYHTWTDKSIKTGIVACLELCYNKVNIQMTVKLFHNHFMEDG